MTHYTYLLIELLTVLFCVIFSFHRKIRFDSYFGAFAKGSVLVALPFIFWDVWFTATNVWWFNDRYLLGLRLLGLPIEEWLFFICIPFSCVFTYFVINKHWKGLRLNNKLVNAFVLLCVLICFVVSGTNLEKPYPMVTFLITAVSLLLLKFIFQVDWLIEASLIFTLLLIPFFMVNGVLTGTGLDEPIVNYNPLAFLNIRILTIPIEDAVYGYTLFIWNVYLFHYFSRTAPKPALRSKPETV